MEENGIEDGWWWEATGVDGGSGGVQNVEEIFHCMAMKRAAVGEGGGAVKGLEADTIGERRVSVEGMLAFQLLSAHAAMEDCGTHTNWPLEFIFEHCVRALFADEYEDDDGSVERVGKKRTPMDTVESEGPSLHVLKEHGFNNYVLRTCEARLERVNEAVQMQEVEAAKHNVLAVSSMQATNGEAMVSRLDDWMIEYFIPIIAMFTKLLFRCSPAMDTKGWELVVQMSLLLASVVCFLLKTIAKPGSQSNLSKMAKKGKCGHQRGMALPSTILFGLVLGVFVLCDGALGSDLAALERDEDNASSSVHLRGSHEVRSMLLGTTDLLTIII